MIFKTHQMQAKILSFLPQTKGKTRDMPCQPPPSIHYLSYLLYCLTSYIILYHKITLRQTYLEFPLKFTLTEFL